VGTQSDELMPMHFQASNILRLGGTGILPVILGQAGRLSHQSLSKIVAYLIAHRYKPVRARGAASRPQAQERSNSKSRDDNAGYSVDPPQPARIEFRPKDIDADTQNEPPKRRTREYAEYQQ